MDKKFKDIFVVMGVILCLAACGPGAVAEVETTPSQSPIAETNVPAPSPVPISGTSTAAPSKASHTFDCDRAGEITVWECRALVALFGSTQGVSWKDHSGWLEVNTPCNWYGVTCEEGHVTELVLFDNGLSGSLPVELADLTHLRVLRMFNNQLSGNLSPELGRLSNLMELDLALNHLNGEIPPELGRLTKLTWLNLSGNGLSGAIPAELGALEQLNYLDLANNQLSESIPGSLGKLLNLSTLDLSRNQLSGSIPAELVHLPSNSWLDLSYNQLSGALPDEWTTKSINDVPARSGMSTPRLWGNQLEGTIPASKDSSTDVLFEGIRFRYPSSLAESVWPQIVTSPPLAPGESWWGSDAPHYALSFASLSGPEAFRRTWGNWFLLPPQIKVYPLAGLNSDPLTRTRVEALHELLKAKPAAQTDEIPVLPLMNAAQVFRAQVLYLDFQNGKGVRFLTQYRQDPGPITNEEIFYTFQGLTNDGAYYVVASFPISTAVLSDTIPFESPAFREFEKQNFQEYLKEQVSMLDALPSDQFEPDLAILDEVVASLEIQSQ